MKQPININQKLKDVPINHRVFCYDATIIIDFLNKTFMPLHYFVKREEIHKLGAGTSPRMEHMKDPGEFLNQFLSVGKMYDYYCLFRQQMDYTSPLETRWRFGLIIKKLLYSKNGWQFSVKRVGKAQIWHAGPILLRTQVSEGEKINYPIKKIDVLAGQVEASGEDLKDEDDEEVFLPVQDTPVTPNELLKAVESFDNTRERNEIIDTLNAGTEVHYAKNDYLLPKDYPLGGPTGPNGTDPGSSVNGISGPTAPPQGSFSDQKSISPNDRHIPGQFTDDPTLSM